MTKTLRERVAKARKVRRLRKRLYSRRPVLQNAVDTARKVRHSLDTIVVESLVIWQVTTVFVETTVSRYSSCNSTKDGGRE